MIILYPLLEKPENTKEFWGGWAVMSILPAYNFYLDRQLEDGIITRRDVFKKNMVAWHLLGAIAYFSLQGEEASTEKKGGSLGIAFSPSNQGTQVSLHYQF